MKRTLNAILMASLIVAAGWGWYRAIECECSGTTLKGALLSMLSTSQRRSHAPSSDDLQSEDQRLGPSFVRSTGSTSAKATAGPGDAQQATTTDPGSSKAVRPTAMNAKASSSPPSEPPTIVEVARSTEPVAGEPSSSAGAARTVGSQAASASRTTIQNVTRAAPANAINSVRPGSR